MRQLLPTIAIPLLVLAGHSSAVTFQDGQVHVIDAANSYPFDSVAVQDGPGSAPTTLVVVAGGAIGTFVGGELNAIQNSVISFSGGELGGTFFAQGDTHVSISGGQFRRIDLRNDAELEFSDGNTPWIEARQNSVLRISGGITETLELSDSAHLEFFDGEVEDGLSMAGSATAVITGGALISIHAEDSSQVTLRGGVLGPQLLVLNAARITIVGSTFNYPLGPLAATSGTLTGVLSDGTALSVAFGRASEATIILASASDTDQDGVDDGLDNCSSVPNPSQADTDLDGVGDACNDALDADGDEWADALDNCASIANPDQANADGDASGDACDPFPNDPDNEQAQCEADLGDATTSLAVCSADLGQCLVQLESPDVLLQTASMGPEGEDFLHFGVTATQFVGSRFEVLAPVTTGSVGAHVVETFPQWGGSPGDLFAALVRLDGPNDYPDSFALDTPDVVGSALVHLPSPGGSTEIAAELAAPLTPGWYALVLGSGRLGADGGGAVTLNNPILGSPSSFVGLVDSLSWQPDGGALVGSRLFVRTESLDLLSCEGDLAQCQMTLIDGNGDVNGDGSADIVDSVLFRRWLAGYPNP